MAITLMLQNPVPGRRPVGCVVSVSGESVSIDIPLTLTSEIADVWTYEGPIAATALPCDVNLKTWALRIRTSSGWDTLGGMDGLPELFVDSTILALPDMRVGQADELRRRWRTGAVQPVLLIEGEGGVGKTYLCGRLVEEARNQGFSIAHTPLEFSSEASFVAEIAWLLLAPEVRASLRTADREFARDLFRTIARGHGLSDAETDLAALADLIVGGAWSGENTAPLMLAMAQLMAKSARPVLFVIGNTHRMSDTVADVLKSLLSALDTVGWGNVRLIVEARDTPEDLGAAWTHFRGWMVASLGEKVLAYTVPRLDRADVVAWLDRCLVSLSPQDVASTIWSKCGGNPLYLTSFLQSCLEEHIVRRNIEGSGFEAVPYSLPSLPRLSDFVASIGSGVDDILRRRITFWDARSKLRHGEEIGGILGIFAVIGRAVPSGVLHSLSASDPETIEAALDDYCLAGLLTRRSAGILAFSHEFIGSAAVDWFTAGSDASETVQTALRVRHPDRACDEYLVAYGRGRLFTFIRRVDSAIEQFNAALQHAGPDFSKHVRCHEELHRLLSDALSTDTALVYHANINRLLHTGYYTLSADRVIGINIDGMASLDRPECASMDRGTLSACRQKYLHNLSNMALKKADLGAYVEYSKAAVGHCASALDLSRIVNRVIKACGLSGDLALGVACGELAAAFEEAISREDDPDIPAVWRGELASLYALASPEEALVFAEAAFENPSSPRQRFHDHLSRASVHLRRGDLRSARSDVEAAETLADENGLSTVRAQSAQMRGLLDLQDGALLRAADVFRFGLAEADWQGNRRDALKLGANLLFVRASLGDHTSGRRLHEALMTIVADVATACVDARLGETKRAVDLRISMGEEWSRAVDRRPRFPPLPEAVGTFLTPIIANAMALSRLWSDVYAPATAFGLTEAMLPDRRQIAAWRRSPEEGSDPGLSPVF